MGVKVKVEPINRDVAAIIDETLSPRARSAMLAETAQAYIDDARQVNTSILGRRPRERLTVDGREGVPLTSVRPDGVIIDEFFLLNDVLRWIADTLRAHSPVGSPPEDPHPGLYRDTITLYADGVETKVGEVLPDADEYIFMPQVPYSRKIERGSSDQAPEGVFEAVADLARAKFSNVALIRFSYRTAVDSMIIGGRLGNVSETRLPVIVVKVR